MRIVQPEDAVETLAHILVAIVELAFELAPTCPLPLDKAEQGRASRIRQQHFAGEKLGEQIAIEASILRVGQEIVFARKEVLAPYEKADVLCRSAVPPVEAELVHVGDEAPPGLHRLVAEQAASRAADIVEALLDRAARAPLPVLLRVELRADVLELAQDLRDRRLCGHETSRAPSRLRPHLRRLPLRALEILAITVCSSVATRPASP